MNDVPAVVCPALAKGEVRLEYVRGRVRLLVDSCDTLQALLIALCDGEPHLIQLAGGADEGQAGLPRREREAASA